MRVIFWGTSDFAVPSLERIFEQGFEISFVVTTPEKHAGRGLKLKPSPVRITAEKLGLKILEPVNPNTDEIFQKLNEKAVDVCVLSAYRFMIKSKLLNLPAKGFVNIHPSLLPKYRGAAPIQRAIMNGESVTGVTTFFMNEQMDAGDIILQTETAIGNNETYDELNKRLAQLGADLIIKTLNLIKEGNVACYPQDNSQVTFAPKISKEECLIDWRKSARQIHNQIRGLSKEPGAYTYFRNKRVKILESTIPNQVGDILKATGTATPGKIIAYQRNLFVNTNEGYIQILSLQMEGSKIISGTDFINGQRLKPDECFESK